MNLQALNHIPISNYAFAYGTNQLRVRLQTAKNDMDLVEIIYGEKFSWNDNKKAVMPKVMSDDRYDYYQFEIEQEDTRIGYYFKLTKGETAVLYSEVGIIREFEHDQRFGDFFQYPYINPVDVHTIPEWCKDAVFYQIFVERFHNGRPSISPKGLSKWDAKPEAKSFFGGDLYGIIEKLDHLKELGVNGIYLTPIFTSPTNHKYDTVNYFEIDRYFGDENVLRELIDKAHSCGIRIILDAVFNHCSKDFPQFLDVREHGKESRFYDWFFVDGEKPDVKKVNYKTFAYSANMPKLNTANPEVKEYLLSAVRHWTKEYGIDGWRLDVSDEIDHQFWREFRKEVKDINPEAVIIGENWYNAYAWLMGDQFDSVMNYPVTRLCQEYFARNEITPVTFEQKLGNLLMRYSDQVNGALLNLLDSHDTERFLYSCKEDIGLLKLAAAFLFAYKGMPCTYYGTEIGMTGCHDPGCRKGFDWNQKNWDQDLYAYYRQLISLRKDLISFQEGEVQFCSRENLFAMKRSTKGQEILIVINRTGSELPYLMPQKGKKAVRDLITDTDISIDKKNGTIRIPAMTAYYLKLK